MLSLFSPATRHARAQSHPFCACLCREPTGAQSQIGHPKQTTPRPARPTPSPTAEKPPSRKTTNSNPHPQLSPFRTVQMAQVTARKRRLATCGIIAASRGHQDLGTWDVRERLGASGDVRKRLGTPECPQMSGVTHLLVRWFVRLFVRFFVRFPIRLFVRFSVRFVVRSFVRFFVRFLVLFFVRFFVRIVVRFPRPICFGRNPAKNK